MVYDVIVSGLGPAGTSFLKAISGSGLKVLALDKEEFPRKKPCAGGLTVKAYQTISSLFDGLDKVIRFTVRTMELHYERGSAQISSPSPLTYLTDRSELDDFLLKSVLDSEFKVQLGESCLSVERLEDGNLLVRTSKGSYPCRVLVVCEGVNSKIAYQFKVKRDIGLTYEADINSPLGKLIVDFSRFSWGYYWAFPKGDFTTTGVGEFKGRELFRELPKLLNWFNERHGLRGRVLWERGFPIPAGKGKNDVYRERVLFLGDAGGLVDPLTGEGIYYAVKSGVIAAEVVKSAFKDGNFSKLYFYKELVDKEFGQEFKWARVVGRIFFPMRGFNFFLLRRSKELSLLAARLLSGDISYKEGLFSYLKFVPGALF